MSSDFPTTEAAALSGVSEDRIRRFVRDGVLDPRRGPKGEYRFSFQDVVLLRAAGDLASRLPARKISRALRSLKASLPSGSGLAGVNLSAEGAEVLVREGDLVYDPVSGQTVLDFDDEPLPDNVELISAGPRRATSPAEGSAEEWFDAALELEVSGIEDAARAYQNALSINPRHADACINLGRILHFSGDAFSAVSYYRRALEQRPRDATALFNLGVALEDCGDTKAAVQAYDRAIACDPALADAHFNAARLCELNGDPAGALRHLRRYREIVRAPG